MRIATQNVGGMRGEFQTGFGPKQAVLRQLLRRDINFVILTEVKAKERHLGRFKLKYNLRPTMHSLHEEAHGGVIIYSHRGHSIIEGSQREATRVGHIAAAVYMVKGTRTVVAGVYGDPSSNDRTSVELMEELDEILEELQHVYHTRTVIIAGDFNATMHPRDANAGTNTAKPRTARKLTDIMSNHNLTDLALAANRPWHTWFRPSNQGQSSRIDLILTSMTCTPPRVNTTLLTFDHVFLEASFNVAPADRTTTMRDYILGSDEYLIKSQEMIEEHMGRCRREAEEEQQNLDEGDDTASPPPPPDAGRIFDDPEEGLTALHVLNELIGDLQALHNTICKNKNKQQADRLQEPSKLLLQLKGQLRRARVEDTRTRLHEQITDIQKTVRDDIEAKAQAAHMRIRNFYRSQTGKMVPETFSCIKDSKRDRTIHRLEHEGRDITAPEEIVDIMQKWYETTAQQAQPQLLTLDEFLQESDLQLPQLSPEDCDELEAEFTMEEVKEAIKEAKVVSAPGPSGQTITFYKLLFSQTPELMTKALNQLVFVPSLVQAGEFRWVQERKVIYIPKKAAPTSPGDYRPLSLLEVLYKIPSRILAKRLTRVLPKLIGPHQHGFMQKKGIQEPSLLATHLIEEAHKKEKPLQMVSFDIEKAFDKVGHSVITQALRAFGVPEIMVQALRQYTLVGFARVEVNGRKGILITIRTGSGQGDPLSSILFLLASEPLNRALVARHTNLMYVTNEGLRTGPKVYADDNLLPLSLTTAQDITPVLNTYQQYTQVSGLRVNISKTAALCINTPQDIVEGIQQMGINTPDHIKHLGIHLGRSLDETVEETIRQIQPKAIMRRILATTPPTDILHRATLINAAFLPIYNHVFMAVPVSTEHSDALFKEVTKFLWTRQQEGQTVNKRTRVSKDRVSADIEMGGLKIAHPKELVKGFQQNLIQRILQKDTLNIPSLLPELLQGLLHRVHRPTLEQHIEHLGPVQWKTTGDSLLRENTMLGQAFLAMADLLSWHETSRESWHCAAISGHTLLGDNAGMMTEGEAQLLEEAGIHTVSQLFREGATGQLSQEVDNDLIEAMAANAPWIRPKLRALTNGLNRIRLPLHGKQKCGMTSGALLVRGERHLSIINKEIVAKQHADRIGTAPAYQTRIRDNVYRPDRDTFHAAYKILELPGIPSKTKEIAFEVLNRTIWTNNKAFKSRMAPSPGCERCAVTETMEHLLYECEHYSAPLWAEYGAALTGALQETSGQAVAQIRLTPREIIFNAPHPSILLHTDSVQTRQALCLLVQEIKRGIVYKRMNITGRQGDPAPLVRIQAHLISIHTKVRSFLAYQGVLTNKDPLKLMDAMIRQLTNRVG